jgi:hypothetical protein
MTTHASFNDLVRRAAGREDVARRPELEAARKVGDLGIGRGGAARPKRRDKTTQINRDLRAAMTAARGRIRDHDLWD